MKEQKTTKISNNDIKSYKKDATYSYTLGAFPTFELMNSRPEIVQKVYMHSSFTDAEKLTKTCQDAKIRLEINDKMIAKLSDKENCFVIGVFDKYGETIDAKKPHIVLVHPGNMGNMGTILRTAVGFGIFDVAIILPGSDIFNPKTVRSSMGAAFRLRHQCFESFEEYQSQYPEHDIYTFMLDGDKTLSIYDKPETKLFSLVFGNEATGLDASFKNIGTSIFIPQSEYVDSLNLTIAVGIGAFVFMKG